MAETITRTCNKCGKEAELAGTCFLYSVTLHKILWKDTGETVSFDMCFECLKPTIDSFKIPPDVVTF